MLEPGSKRVAAILICVGFAASFALADTWMPPGGSSHYSRGREFRLSVFPRAIASAGDYWRNHGQGPQKPGQKVGERDVCVGQLEKRDEDGSYALVWKRELVNDVSPVTALVTADGRYVVTFDNWHTLGYGTHVVVIYGPGGRLVVSLGLADFLSAEQIAELPRSVSSIRWGGARHFNETEEQVVLQVAVNGHENEESRTEWHSVVISLKDGRIRAMDKE